MQHCLAGAGGSGCGFGMTEGEKEIFDIFQKSLAKFGSVKQKISSRGTIKNLIFVEI